MGLRLVLEKVSHEWGRGGKEGGELGPMYLA